MLYEKNWTKLVTEQLKRFERALVESERVEGLPQQHTNHWSFGGALLYSVALLTTVGKALKGSLWYIYPTDVEVDVTEQIFLNRKMNLL